MQSRFTKVGVLMVALLFVFSTFAFGQGAVAGSVSGTVEDAQGAVIAGAKITAKDAATNTEFKTESNSTGNFRLAGLPPGNYNVTVEAPKFSKLATQNVTVYANRDTAMGRLALKVGSTEEVVNVEGTAPLIETTSSQITKSFESRQVAELPLNGGGTAFDSLALLVPGVTNAQDAGFSNTNGADLSVNGQRGRSNNFQIDGQSNNDNSVAGPQYFVNNQDLIAEFQVVTNNFSAEYGRNMGSVVNYVTKSGSNAFHGSAFEFYTGNWADAKVNEERSGVFGFCEPGQAEHTETPFTDPFDPVTNTGGCEKSGPPPRYVDNRFGGTLGGPIWKDKAWFFGSYVMQRIRQTQTASVSGTSITPTPAGLAALAAAFPGSPAVAFINQWGPFAIADGNPQIAGATQNVLVSDGVTTATVQMAPISRSLPGLFNDQQWTVRGDWQISNKDRFFARYLREDTDNTNASGTGWNATRVDVPGVTNQIGLDYTRAWTNNYTMQLRTSYSRADIGFEGGPLGCLRATIMECPSRIGFSAAGTNGAFGQATNLPQGRLVNNTQYQGNNVWVVGRHNLKFGGEYDRQRSPNVFLPNINGSFTFRGDAGCGTYSALGTTPAEIAELGGALSCGFSNFIANHPSQLQLADAPSNGKFEFKEQDLAFYFQDDWRIKDNLTLNLGLRWEWNQQAINLLHDLTTAQQTGPAPFWNTSLPLERTTLPKIPQDLNNWGPNVGFAYTPRFWKSVFGEDKTVIRGGFRIAYDPSFYNIFLNVATAAPVVNLGTITTGGAPGFAPGLVGADTSGASLRAAGYLGFIPVGGDPGFRSQTNVAADFHNPYAEQWSLGIQRSITSKMAYEIRYVGNHTIGNFMTINANPLIGSATSATACTGGQFTNAGAAVNVSPVCLARDFPSLVPAGLTPCTSGTSATTPGFGRVDCDRSLVRQRKNEAFSIYHSLQQEIRFQNWHGLSSGMNWTWSKAIDNVSEIFSTLSGGNAVAGAQNPFQHTIGERGVGGTSYTHTATIFWIYDMPWYKNQTGLLGRVLGGWQWNGTWRYDTGQPFNPFQAVRSGYCDNSFNTTFFGSLADTCRPVLSSESAAIDTVGRYRDSDPAAAFVPVLTDFNQPCSGTVGSATCPAISPDSVHWIINDNVAARALGNPFLGVGRNTFTGQSYNQVNLGLIKTTKVNEQVSFKLQVNLQNAFNRQFRGVPDPLIDDGQFDPANGLTGSFMNNYFNNSGTNTRRRMTIGLKVIF
jgi:hypothetical protein